MNDPGMMTDSTGEGMAGAMDIAFGTQQNFKNTLYNGTKVCSACGLQLDPYTSLHTELCGNCTQRRATALVKNRMAS